MSRIRIPGLVRVLYNHNPFYLISAVLFLYGLRLLFRPGQVELLFARGSVDYINPWWLMLAMCGITLLMAVTAWLIVRLGRVWEDARSLVLILLFMFLAISVSFDEIVTVAAREDGSVSQAVGLFVFGLAFSLCVSEALIRGLKIGLPWGYRAPMYALITLFFAFPLWVSPEISEISIDLARWRVAAFPAIAGLLTLPLLPAIRRGSQSLNSNGTPWRWPWFPWTAFVFLAGAVCFRSYSLAISFDLGISPPDVKAEFWDTSFGVYFLVPFLLGVLFVLLEVGLVERLKRLQSLSMWGAALVPFIAYPAWLPFRNLYTYWWFVDQVVQKIGSPVFIALLGVAVFYGIAWLRGLRRAELGFIATILGLVFTGTGDLRPDVTDPHVWPLVILGVLEMALGSIRGRSRELLVGASALAVAIGLQFEVTAVTGFRATVIFHLILGSVLVIGGVFRDRLAKFLRPVGAVTLAVTGLAALFVGNRFGITVDMLAAYVAALTVVAFVWWAVLRERLFAIAALINLTGSACSFAWWMWQKAQRLAVPDGVKPLAWACVCFAIAVFISMLKGGLANRIQARWGPDETVPNSGESPP